MIGEWGPVWRDTWREIWAPLARQAVAPDDLFVELFSALAERLSAPLSAQALAEAIDSPNKAKSSFKRIRSPHFRDEAALTAFMADAFAVAEDLGGDQLSNKYFLLTQDFMEKFSLRYDLRRPFSIHPTLTGVFSGIMRELKAVAVQDANLLPILHDFEESLRDLTADDSERNIKTCIQKQINLLEALGQKNPNTAGNTLGQICNEVGSWPHAKVKDAVKSLYGFACDYPGIRHAGTPANQIRPLGMNDLVALSVLLAGFTPYLSHELDGQAIYRR